MASPSSISQVRGSGGGGDLILGGGTLLLLLGEIVSLSALIRPWPLIIAVYRPLVTAGK